MTQWYDKNYNSPYPSFRECEQMANDGGISINQVKQWFVNVRRRTQNKNRITRDNRTIDGQINDIYKSYNNFLEDSSTKQANERLPQYLSLAKNQEKYSNAMLEPSSCCSVLPSTYQSQHQIQSPTLFYPNYYTPNYNSMTPVFSNYTRNYMPFNASSSPNFSNQYFYNHASQSHFSDSCSVGSPNNSFDVSSMSSLSVTNLDNLSNNFY